MIESDRICKYYENYMAYDKPIFASVIFGKESIHNVCAIFPFSP